MTTIYTLGDTLFGAIRIYVYVYKNVSIQLFIVFTFMPVSMDHCYGFILGIGLEN